MHLCDVSNHMFDHMLYICTEANHSQSPDGMTEKQYSLNAHPCYI